MEYLGEWTGTATLGQGLIALAFGASFVALIAFLCGWKSIGRKALYVHATSTFAVIALIFMLFIAHRYEFEYIWKHLNNEMPMRFIFSAFWAGKKGDSCCGCSGTMFSASCCCGRIQSGTMRYWPPLRP